MNGSLIKRVSHEPGTMDIITIETREFGHN